VPTVNIGTNWHAAVFDDSGWTDGLTGIGYDTRSDYDDYINTDVEALMNNNIMNSAYIRIPFNVDDPEALADFSVKMRYEDGVAVWLNGVLIAEDNLPVGVTGETLTWDAMVPSIRSDGLAVVMTEIFSSTNVSNYLVAGINFLAIHGINEGPGSSDFLMQAQITGNLLGVFNLVEERYFATPTPGAVNSGSAIDFVEDTKFSVDRGFYTNAFALTISTDTEDAEIRYTLDGSTPSAVTGEVYAGPLTISKMSIVRAAAFRAGWQASDVDTQTYIFPADVLEQPVLPTGWPTEWTGGYSDYEMNPDIVDSPAYSNQFPEVLTRIPSLSIVTDQQNLFGASGIYDNSLQEGVAWERVASVELINPDGAKGFQVNCGLRMQGGASRNPSSSPKHSFRLLFKDVYGPSKLSYDLFDDSPVDEFDTIILRAGYNLSWIHRDANQRASAQYARDLFARRVQSSMGHAASHGRMVHLYVNGLYWGLYNPSERPTADFASSHLGGSKDDWDTNNSGEFKDGDSIAWNEMFAIANAGLTNLVSYESFMQYCDVVNLADYMILNHYIGNLDWDHHNFYAGRRRRTGEGYKFFCWDSENSFRSTGSNRVGLDNANKPTRLFTKARENSEFKLLVADRLHRHFFNDGVLTTTGATALWQEISDLNDTIVVAESARWGDYRGAYTLNDHYLPQQSWIMNTYFPVRTATVLSQYTALGLYPSLAAPEFNVHGGMFTNSMMIALSGSASVYYTLDGSDPREFGTGSAVGTLLAGFITLEHSTRVKARCYDGSTWSALTEADFYDLSPSPLRITEIMHSPRTPDSNEMLVSDDSSDYKFIEICNPAPAAALLWSMNEGDLVESWRVNGDVSYTFPDYAVLPAGVRVLILPFDPLDTQLKSAFVSRYNLAPSVALFGPYDGKLSNQGGRLTLEKPQAPDAVDEDLSWIIVDELNFYDDAPWTVPPDGLGYALHRVEFGAAAADPASWLDGVPSPGMASISQPDLRINSFGWSSGCCLLFFDLLPDIEYMLESKTNLLQNKWLPRASLMKQSEYLSPIDPASQAEFYRLQRK
jgi:hypothetical protein